VDVARKGLVNRVTSKEICAVVDERRPDFLVLGSAGKTRVKGLIVGSVSNFCVSNANCAVIVVRMPIVDDDGHVFAPNNVVAAKEWRGFVNHPSERK
jgi:hypothetical protein